ncbi:PA domain-containing protein [Streptomyces sp. NPDC002265]|uniref:PA domain-containing protein n=1 Tax=Streptomyces sp. NPDC002265 TaxID=3154415 RepID=UPI00331D6C45
MSTSTVTADISAYRGGSGRLDISAASRTQITASGSVDTGLIKWSSDPQPVERRITYTNSADRAVTLQLTLDRQEGPGTLFALGADQVTVPAHDSASVSVTLDPRGAAVGSHTGQVIARDGAGVVAAHTVLSFTTESERHDLTLLTKDREGRPTTGTATLRAAQEPDFHFYTIPQTGLTLRLPRDTYSVMMFKDVQGTHGAHSTGLALLGDPEIELTQDQTVQLDASQTRQVRALTPRPSMPTNTRAEYWRSFTSARPEPGTFGDWIESKMIGPDYDSVWAQPTPDKVTHGGFAFTTRWRAPQTPLTLSHGGREMGVLPQNGAKPLPDGTTAMDAVFADTGTPAAYAHLSARGKTAVVRRTPGISPSEQSRAAQAAGVKLLLVVNNATGRLNTWYGDADYHSPGPVAAASVTQNDGEALIAEISASRGRPVRLRATAHPVPGYLYDLVSYHTGGIPEDLTLRAGPHNLARVDAVFGQGKQTPAAEMRMDHPPYVFGGGWNFLAEPVAHNARTDWVSTGGDITWQQQVGIPNLLTETSEPVSYRPATTHADRWLTPVLRPRMISEDLPVRHDGSALDFTTRAWGDSGTAHAGQGYGTGLSQRTSLYQGTTLLAESDYDNGHAWDLPPERLPYKLVVDATADNTPFSPYSPTTHTAWTFTSAQAERRTIPLVQLDYAVELNAQGEASRTSSLTLTPSVLGAPHTRVSSVHLEVSYDNGATWHRQTAAHHDGTWTTRLAAPRTASFVSLRTTAEDETEGTITQTVIRAYGLT